MVDFEVRQDKGRLLMTLQKDLTSNTTPTMEQAWQDFVQRDDPLQWRTVFVDLRETRILDSVGLNWLFAFYRQLAAAGKKIVLRVSSPAIKRVLDFACFDEFVEIRFRRRRQTR